MRSHADRLGQHSIFSWCARLPVWVCCGSKRFQELWRWREGARQPIDRSALRRTLTPPSSAYFTKGITMKRTYQFENMAGTRLTTFETREELPYLVEGNDLHLETDDYQPSEDAYLHIEDVMRFITFRRGRFWRSKLSRDTVLVRCSVQSYTVRTADGVIVPATLPISAAAQPAQPPIIAPTAPLSQPAIPPQPAALAQVRVRRRPPAHDPRIDEPRRNLGV
jgi:hypothetical protein